LSSRRGDNFRFARPQARRREHRASGKPSNLLPRARDSAVRSALIWRCSAAHYDFDRSIRSETVAIRSMTLGVPVADAALYLIEKVGTACIRQMSDIANEVCDCMLVARAAISLKNRHRFRGSGNVPCLIDIPTRH
jgi:hypothetical protein